MSVKFINGFHIVSQQGFYHLNLEQSLIRLLAQVQITFQYV